MANDALVIHSVSHERDRRYRWNRTWRGLSFATGQRTPPNPGRWSSTITMARLHWRHSCRYPVCYACWGWARGTSVAQHMPGSYNQPKTNATIFLGLVFSLCEHLSSRNASCVSVEMRFGSAHCGNHLWHRYYTLQRNLGWASSSCLA